METKTPRKKVSDKHQLQQRVRIVMEWILMDYPSCDIISQGKEKWGVTERQMYRYIGMAESEFAKMNETKIEKKRAYHIQRRKKIIRDMDDKFKKTPQGASVVLEVNKDIARLEGLYVEKHEHKHEYENDVTVTIGAKTFSKE